MASILLLLSILILNITLWVILFIRLRKEFSPYAVLHAIRDEVDKLIIEINRVADRDITLIDARRTGLKQLLDEIDKKLTLHESLVKSKNDEHTVLKKLTRINEQPVSESSVPDSLFGESVQMPLNSSDEKISDFDQRTVGTVMVTDPQPVLPVNPLSRAATVYKRNEIPELNTEPLEKIERVEEPIHITFSSDPISPKKDKRKSVLKMAHEGFSAEIIAEKLKIPVREVSLIMDLYN